MRRMSRSSRWLAGVLILVLAACAPPRRPDDKDTAMGAGSALVGVEKRMFTTKNFTFESGQALPEMTLAYETYGKLDRDGRNAILITHGFTSSHHAADTHGDSDQPGFWDGLIGPGKAIDTERYFVVSSNMLGSSYGSTAPRSINPVTGKPYGPDFPRHTVVDIVRAQKALLEQLGVKHLVAVAGPSYGGYQPVRMAGNYSAFIHWL